jgi:hypothetical protein
MGSVRKYNDIKLDDINYSKPEKIGNSYFGSMCYGDGLSPLYIQTPIMKAFNNVSDIKDKKNPYLDVEVCNKNFDLYDFFLNLDDKNIKKTFQKSKDWFGKEIPLEGIDDMYKRLTKPCKKDQNPIIRFRLPVVKNKIQCGVYNQQKVFIDINEIKKDSEIILILHIRGLKILKQYYYCDCYISQIKVFQDKENKYNIIPEYSVIDDDEGDDEYKHIFDEEILIAFNEELEKEKELEKQKELEEQKQKELEKKELEEKIRQKKIEMEELMKQLN